MAGKTVSTTGAEPAGPQDPQPAARCVPHRMLVSNASWGALGTGSPAKTSKLPGARPQPSGSYN